MKVYLCFGAIYVFLIFGVTIYLAVILTYLQASVGGYTTQKFLPYNLSLIIRLTYILYNALQIGCASITRLSARAAQKNLD